MSDAKALMERRDVSPKEVRRADAALREAGLPDIDVIWVSWRYFRDRILEKAPKVPTSKPGRRAK
ncbi:MAG: hypothetical protein R3A48_04000 [Polyangiales bacterium]